MTIGVRRSQKVPKSPGPGEYTPERADSLTKTKSISYKISKGMIESQSTDFNLGPGVYSPEQADN
jgi:hypothetical protein